MCVTGRERFIVSPCFQVVWYVKENLPSQTGLCQGYYHASRVLDKRFQLFQPHECLIMSVCIVLYYMNNPLIHLRLLWGSTATSHTVGHKLVHYEKKHRSLLMSDKVPVVFPSIKVEDVHQSLTSNGTSIISAELLAIKLSHLNSVSNRCVPKALQSLLIAISNNCK